MEAESGTSQENISQSEVDEILRLICSNLKLDRDKGVRQLDSLLKNWESGQSNSAELISVEKKKLEICILENLGSSSGVSPAEDDTVTVNVDWEVKHGCLMACYPLIASMNPTSDQIFLRKIQDIALKLLRDPEIRVQLAAGGVLGFLSKSMGPSVYEVSRDTLMELIWKYLQTPVRDPSEELLSPEQGFDVLLPAFAIKEKVTRDTLEWRHLEPTLKCLQFMVENLDTDFMLLIDQRLVDTIMACLVHSNRHVRETGFNICTALIASAPDSVMEFGHQLSQKLSLGLMDHWNQVRLAALSATRKFLITYKACSEEFFPCLLPRLCLNRYYKAEGVRIYTQDTWKLIVGTEGRFLVARHIGDVVKFYITACSSDNPADREAACLCISELAQKIEQNATKPYVDQLLDTLVTKSNDPTWSVRDAACLAFGNITTHYPDESKTHLKVMYDVLFKNLEDPTVLVRQGSATVLAQLVNAYGTETLSLILDKLSIGLRSVHKMRNASPPSVKEEGTAGHKCPGCGTKVEIQAGGANPNIPDSMFCCAPHSQPWHLTDGSLYLIGALAELSLCQSELSALVPLIVDTTKTRDYGEHFIILETFCKIIPLVAKGIGKKPFKEFLALVFEPIFYAVESLIPPTVASGNRCLTFLSQFIGPNILKSRVEQYDPRMVHFLENVERPN